MLFRSGFIGLGSDRARAESGTGAIGRRVVERRTDDGDVGLPRVEVGGIGNERSLAEGREASEVVAEVELFAHASGEIASSAPIRRGHVLTLPIGRRRTGGRNVESPGRCGQSPGAPIGALKVEVIHQ